MTQYAALVVQGTAGNVKVLGTGEDEAVLTEQAEQAAATLRGPGPGWLNWHAEVVAIDPEVPRPETAQEAYARVTGLPLGHQVGGA